MISNPFLFPAVSLFQPCLRSWGPAQNTPSLEGLDQVSISQVLRGPWQISTPHLQKARVFPWSQVSADEETSACCICSRSRRVAILFIMYCAGSLHSQRSGSIDSCGVAASEAELLCGSPERAEMEPSMLSAFSREGCKLWAGGAIRRR